MAQKVQIVLVDDLDGGPAEECVRFALDGTSYEIDLNATNAAGLRDALAEYVAHARKVTAVNKAKTSGSRTRHAADNSRTHAVRLWAREQGIDVGERGRVPLTVRAQYDASHPGLGT